MPTLYKLDLVEPNSNILCQINTVFTGCLRNKVALSVLLTKYNAVGVPSTEPISLTYQLNKRCTQLPEKVSIPYFIKVLDMQEQYREVMEKDKQEGKGFYWRLFS